MHAPNLLERPLRVAHAAVILLVLGQVVGEIRAAVFEVEFRLLEGVEPRDEVVHPRPAGDEDQLVFGEAFHGLMRRASRARAGDRARR